MSVMRSSLDIQLQPIFIKPHTVSKPWAGSKLNDVLHKNVPSGTGETWECSRKSIVSQGSFIDLTLEQVFNMYPQWFGTDKVNLLTKFIDAKHWLSVQVHPNDEDAQKLDNEPNGKTEAWYFIDVDDGSQVINGIDDIPCEGQKYLDVSSFIEVENDRAMTIPAGTVHAIGPGILLYEVQQYSDLTYRLFDWHRTDRELHLKKGLEVVSTRKSHLGYCNSGYDIHDTYYFTTKYYEVDGCLEIKTPDTWQAIVYVSGSLTIKMLDIIYEWELGQTAIIPKIAKYYIMGKGTLLVSQPTNGVKCPRDL